MNPDDLTVHHPPAPRKGMMVAVFGPDGSGKSSLVRALEVRMREEYAGVLIRHWRPNIVNRRPDGVPVEDPHGKKPRPGWTNLPRVFLLIVDFIYGHFALYRPAIRSGQLVIFDRYYNDLEADPLRYRFAGGQRWVRLLGRWVPKPHLSMYLDVRSEIAAGRKCEVDLDLLSKIIQNYRKIAVLDPSAVIINAERSQEEVLAVASDAINRRNPIKKREEVLSNNSRVEELQHVLDRLKGVPKNDSRKNGQPEIFCASPLPRNQMIAYQASSKKSDIAPGLYDLYRPLKRSGRIYRIIRSMAMNIGAGSFRISIPENFMSYLKERTGCDELRCTVLMTQPGASSKLIIRCADAQRNVLAYVKVGWRDFNRIRIQNEAHFLTKLADRPLASAGHSRLLWKDDESGVVVTALKPVPGVVKYCVKQGLYQPILKDLQGRDALVGKLLDSDYWKIIRHRADALKHPYAKNVLDLVLKYFDQEDCSQSMHFGWSHGDFAPWNLRDDKGRPWLIDWEDARTNAPVGLDEVYMFMQSEIFLKDRSVFQALQNLFRSAISVNPNIKILATLSLLEQFIRFYEEGRLGADVRQHGSALIILSRSDWREVLL